MVAYIANTLVFILSGVVIAEGILGSESVFKHHGYPWGYLLLLYVLVQVARLVVVGVFFPLFQRAGYGMDWKEAIVLVWSGLRGAVSLSLALSVKCSSVNSPHISSDTGTLFLFFTGGIVFLTLIINGSTTQFVLHMLNMDKLSTTKRRILNFTRYEMMNRALAAFRDLGGDEELGPAEWAKVRGYVTSLNDLEGKQVHPHSSSNNDIGHNFMNLADIRVRFLNGVQAAYWGMLDEGRITQNTARILMESVEEAIDRVSHEPLCDWRGLRGYVNFPNSCKFCVASFLPQKLVTCFIVGRLESACYICAAFLRAHRIARQQLYDFIGYSGITEIVIKESEEEGEQSRKFLEEVRDTFPKVLQVVKNRQVAYSILNHLIEYVNNLEKIGLLEKKEMIHLHDAVQSDLKRLLRNPPSVKVPEIRDFISSNPLLGSLPSSVCESIIGFENGIMKPRGETLFCEGSKPTGVWLILNGAVKGSSKSMTNKSLLQPTFRSGSTLGLYEVLVGKQYICDVITDSFIICCFIQGEKMRSLLGSDSTVEEYFWKESVVTLAKVLLPRVFETMDMQELRELVAEWSTMNIYPREETFELPHFSIGFLLEGLVKAKFIHEESFNSPAVLLPSQGLRSFHQLETSVGGSASVSHQLLSYQVEAQARVILLDISGFEASRSLQRGSSSRVPHSVEHPSGPLTRESGSLMSWPEHSYKQRSRPGLDYSDVQINNSSFQVNNSQWHPRSHPQNTSSSPSHSQSYTSIPSGNMRRLFPFRSEGSITMPKFDIEEGISHNSHSGYLGPKETTESSDESAGENDPLIRIDSDSNLSSHHPSGASPGR